MGDQVVWIWLWDHLQEGKIKFGSWCCFQEIWRRRVPLFPLIPCHCLAPGCSSGMVVRHQIFQPNPTIAIGSPSFSRILLAQWRDSLERSHIFKKIVILNVLSSGMIWNMAYTTLWLNEIHVNAIRVRLSKIREHSNRVQFHLLFGWAFLWISLLDYPNQETSQ
jgi:hypothetical protein